MARNATADSGSLIFKSGLFAILAGFAFLIFNQFTGNTTGGESPNPKRVKIPDSDTDSSQTHPHSNTPRNRRRIGTPYLFQPFLQRR
jgi:hypothetical protein